MKFNYRLLKKLRTEQLGLSRSALCFKANKEADALFLTMPMLTRLEEGKETNISPNNMAFLYRALGKDPNYFYSIESKDNEVKNKKT